MDEMQRGYLDGLVKGSPEPGGNTSFSYRHGFWNGRDDARGEARASASELRNMARIAVAKDRGLMNPCF